MRQKLYIFGALFLLTALLIGLNTASYVQKETEPDTESSPIRSTYNAGSTGTRVFYELLTETGRQTTRWQQPPSALLSGQNSPETFIIVGPVRREFAEDEIEDLLQWVSSGGKLVIIDREPFADLQTTTANWSLSFSGNPIQNSYSVDPADPKQMTEKASIGKPVQPTVYTTNINAVQPSKFAASVIFERFADGEKREINTIGDSSGIGSGPIPPPPPPPPPAVKPSQTPFAEDVFKEEQLKSTPSPKLKKPPMIFESNSTKDTGETGDTDETDETDETGEINGIEQNNSAIVKPKPAAAPKVKTAALNAPVVHLANSEKNILVDVPYGSGQIVYLSDPYIISNNGINLVDNAQLGINIAASRPGAIAFDEYHHGYGTNNNRLIQYFAGTPVVAIILQIALIIGLILFSQSRRFARALPEDEPNRLSKLEYVSAMAELQQRTKAYDLAIENIYTDFRRRAAKLVGADVYATSREEMTKMLAERAKISEIEIAELMRRCEDIMHGDPTGKKEVLQIASRLREIEEKLGLKRTRTGNVA
ncbi:MAG: hypothetical protein JWN60_2042 [Acidobacteria bacterium]|nr:hypothetical protein [Acidobacteriota bacterium]